MISYTKRVVNYGKTKKLLVSDMTDPQQTILSNLLTSEVPLFYSDIVKCLNAVLLNGEEKHEFAGNSCLISATKQSTRVERIIDGADIGEPCTVKTDELMSLVNEWHKELTVFRKKLIGECDETKRI